MTLRMFDSVDIATIPPDAVAVAGYVAGNWPTFVPLCQRFPKARHVSIAIHGDEDAEALDIEAGDASPGEAPGWVRRQQARGVYRPIVYSSLSSMPEVLRLLGGAGIARNEVRVWTAHYTNSPHLCRPSCGFGFDTTADATQYTLAALGRNLDESQVASAFFDPPPPLNIYHYERFATGPFPYGQHGAKTLDERAVVQEHDHLHKHRVLHAARLHVLHDELVFLRKRVWYEAHHQLEGDGKPSWDRFHRGWRWQQLNHRTK